MLLKYLGEISASSSSMTVIAICLMLGGGSAQASECRTQSGGTGPLGGVVVPNDGVCTLPAYNARDNDGRVGAVVVSGGDHISLKGAGSSLAFGNAGTLDTTLGAVAGGAGGAADQPRLNIGSKVRGVAVSDPVTAANIVVATYDSALFAQTNWLDANVTIPVDVGDNQYINARLGTVQSGTLTVDIGNAALTPFDTANRIRLAAKQTTLVEAVGPGSSIEWASRNGVTLSATSAPAGTTSVTRSISVPVYAGTFQGFDGQMTSVTDAASLAAYNDRLVTALGNGGLTSQAAYDAAFAQAVSFAAKDVVYTYTITANDDVTRPRATNVIIAAKGAGAKGVIVAGGQIDAASGLALQAQDGAIVGVAQGGRLSGHTLLADIESGSSGFNNGVISAGYLSGDNLDTNVATGDALFAYYAGTSGISVADAGSTFTNTGIINSAGYSLATGTGGNSFAISVDSGAKAVNDGIINIGVNNNITSGSVTAALVKGAGTFTNSAGGVIAIGRSAQYDVATPGVDTTNAQAQYGVRLESGQAINAGTIRIGTGTENAVALMSTATDAESALVNTGTIRIDGNAGGAPLLNIGMLAADTGASTVRNDGVIILNGVNSIGVKAQASAGQTATIVDNGTITIANGSDPVSGARNIGVWAEGAGATVQVNGAINLGGVGAIGVHARGGALVDLRPGANMNFVGGTNQIGYFSYGAGSVIRSAATEFDISTVGSTLFRVEDGAQFVGSASRLTASGTNSVVINGSGAGTVVDLATTVLSIPGTGATGILIDGGASGVLRAGTPVELLGQNAVLGIVDGRKIALNGSISTATAPSVLTNAAAITSGATAATGFIAQAGGQLINNGAIAFTNPTGNDTGIIVRSGGSLVNSSTISVANGTGLLIEGVGSTATLNSGSAVNASGGVAAISIGSGGSLTLTADSGAISAGGSAHAVLLGTGAVGFTAGPNAIGATGTGSGIENAGSAAVRLAGTAITVADGTGIRTPVSLDPTNMSTITVTGNGTGFVFAAPNGGDLTLGSGYAITAAGAGAKGIVVNSTGNATLSARVSITNAAGGSALVGGPAATITNSGSLTSASTASPTVDLSGGTRAFTNSGTLAAPAGGTVLLGGTGPLAVTFSGDSVSGGVNLGAGDATFLMTGGTFGGTFNAGGGSDLATFRGLTDASLSSLTAIDGGGTASGSDRLVFDATTITGTRRITGWNALTLANGSRLTADGDLALAGPASVGIEAGSTFQAGNDVAPTIRSSGGRLTVTNAGTIDLTNPSPKPTDRLTIQGDYTGNGGRVLMDTVLAGDGAASDILIFDGANGGSAVSGSTSIIIANAGGLGARTTGNGIQVVGAVNGATTTAQTTRTGFVLGNAGGHIDAGAFEYQLFAGDANGLGEGWYLRTAGGGQGGEGGEGGQGGEGGEGEPTYRSEVALFAGLPGVLRGGDLAILGTLHRRLGDDSASVDSLRAGGRIWGRFLADRYRGRQKGTVNPETHGHSNGFQLGADLLRAGSNGNRHDFGVYGGRLTSRAHIDGLVGGVADTAAGRLAPNTVFAGFYWTYVDRSGFYFDSVVQRSWYGGKARPLDGSRPGIDGTGITGSLEVGYDITLDDHWSIEPQAQFVIQGISLDDIAISNAVVRQDLDGYATGRLGVRVKGSWPVENAGVIKPYARANLWHGFTSTDRQIFINAAASTPIYTRSNYTSGELGGGLTWQILPTLDLYGEASRVFSLRKGGSASRYATTGSIGLRADW